ncbi:FAD binding domain-containing protein [Clostridiaceae bacterium 35-E11]
MKIKNTFTFIAPDSIEIALKHFTEKENAVFLGGGTDYIPLAKYGVKNPQYVIGLDKIERLKKIEMRQEGLFIGAMSTLTELMENEEIKKNFPILGEAAGCVASPQIRNVGTIGGNILQDRRCMYFNQTEYWRQSIEPCFKSGGKICHQAPPSPQCRAIYYSDLAPVLMALDARAVCYDEMNFVQMPLKKVIHNHVVTNGGIAKPKFFITGFIIPYVQSDAWMKFVKHSIRASIEFPIINSALIYIPKDEDSKHMKIKIVVGAVAPEPFELVETEKYIQYHGFTGHEEEKIKKIARDEIRQNSSLIRETGISVKARKQGFGLIGHLLEQWFQFLCE